VFDHGVSRAGGTGLGLTIVRTIAEADGWSVSVAESEAGGARFVFRTGDRV
jgi:signal transduction histidine kinase